MGALCDGPLWNCSLLLDNSWPQFTDCFLHTVLIWVPCAFLFLALPFYVTSVRKSATNIRFKMSSLFGARLGLCVALLALSCIGLLMRVCGLNPSVSAAAYLGDCICILTYWTLCLMTQYEALTGVHSSTVPSLFWLLTSLCNVIPLYTVIIEKTYESHTLSCTVFLISYTLHVCSLLLTALVHNHAITDLSAKKKPCPETTCSFLSYLGFWWMTGLLVKGYKQQLQSADLWQLPAPEQSATLTSHFNTLWTHRRSSQVSGTGPNHQEKNSRCSQPGTRADEETPLLSHPPSPANTAHRTATQERNRPARRLLAILLKMAVRDLGVIVTCKLMSDFLYLLCPLLMGLLMGYLSTRPAGREWQGYMICVAMLMALLLKSLLFAHSMFRAARLGLRMKTTLIAAIYRKALTRSPVAERKTTVGEIVNLMSVDAQRVQDVMVVCFYAATGPLQFVVAVILLYYTIGPAICVGVLLFLCCIPVNAYVISRQRRLQNSSLAFKDNRIRLFQEILTGMKVVKLCAWEPLFTQKIGEIRQEEVRVLFKMTLLNTLMSLCWDLLPFLVTLVTLMTYVLVEERSQLDAGKAFVSLSLFTILRQPLAVMSRMIMYFTMMQVSIKRVSRFLGSEDLDPNAVQRKSSIGKALSIQNGTFTWTSPASPVLTGINLHVASGRLVAVVGPVGCGKSSLISAILGEMHKVKGTVNLQGRVAYVPQQAWIQNGTLRDNILLGKLFIRSKYKAALDLCQLQPDVSSLPAGDLTEIGEKGLTLSGGQRQRVSVGRAVYSDSEVFLMDDPLSALDSQVAKAIFTHVIGPLGILHNKTRILVTHGVHWLPMADEVVVMSEGRIRERGSYEQLLSHDGPFAHFLKNYLTEAFEVEELHDPEIAEIHGRMRERLGSVTSCASSDDDSLRLSRRRTVHQRRRLQSVDLSDSSDTLECSARHRTARPRQSGTPVRQSRKPDVVNRLQARGSGICDVVDSVTLSATSQNDDVEMDRSPSSDSTEMACGGKVPWQAVLYYARALGVCPLMLTFLSFSLYQALSVGSSFWLKEWTRRLQAFSLPDANATCPPIGCSGTGNHSWTNQTQEDAARKETYFCLAIYGAFGLGQAVFLALFNAVYWRRMARGAQTVHCRSVDRLMRAPMAFFDTTATGRILNRMSLDVDTVDTALPIILRDCMVACVMMVVTMMVMVVQSPLSTVIILPIAVLCCLCQRFYVPTTRQLRRLECVTRSPVYVLFSETIDGAASIRAYDVTSRFLEESKQRVDSNQVFFFAYQAAIRWMQWHLDVLAAVLVTSACIFLIHSTTTTAADAGLCISYALQVSGTLTWMTRQMGELQSNIVSVERLMEYSLLQTEAEWNTPDQRPSPEWPQKGEVVFDNFHTRYRPGLDLVLKGVTFTIRHGEKVGIVGRTGAGKSSLTLALFRLIESAGGAILIDGINIAHMGLHDLRTRLAILPQEPVVFSGTLRMNLDPGQQYSDPQLWQALERARLKDWVMTLPGQLTFQCGQEGAHLSAGQRQLVCLARTLLGRRQIVVLDEATAVVDIETDAVIQDTIRSAFRACTIVTIAHRINTIMDCDRVMVMRAGQVKEFAPPAVLLSNKKSEFYAMSKDAGLV